MTETAILDLYTKRDESAIGETQRQYGTYCTAIAMNILHNREDADECVNDALLNAWNAIPPEKPREFKTFLGRIVRNLSINRYNSRSAAKRGGGAQTLLLSELAECVPSSANVEEQVDKSELARTIEAFLADLRLEERVFFVRRYWHGEEIASIAKQTEFGESKVKMCLLRTRKKLAVYLSERGYNHE